MRERRLLKIGLRKFGSENCSTVPCRHNKSPRKRTLHSTPQSCLLVWMHRRAEYRPLQVLYWQALALKRKRRQIFLQHTKHLLLWLYGYRKSDDRRFYGWNASYLPWNFCLCNVFCKASRPKVSKCYHQSNESRAWNAQPPRASLLLLICR